MFKRKSTLKMIMAAMCVVLVLAYAFIVFLPHTHECMETDCAVCAMIEESCNLLVAIVLSATVFQMAKYGVFVHYIHTHILSIRDGTPVGLKVKLSD